MAHSIIFCGSAGFHLAPKISVSLQIPLGKAKISQFNDSECNIKILDNVQDKICIIIQSLQNPVNHNLIELCLMAATLKQQGAATLIAVIPYLAYARQKQHISYLATLLQSAGLHYIITCDLHDPSCTELFQIPVINISTTTLFATMLQNYNIDSPIVIAPDCGAIERAKSLAARINSEYITITKQRHPANMLMHINGDVVNRNCIIVDDIIDSAATVTNAAALLKQMHAKRIIACCTHAVFSTNSLQQLKASYLEELIVTDTINLNMLAATNNKIPHVTTINLFVDNIKIALKFPY